MNKIIKYLEDKHPVLALKDELVTLNVNTNAGKARFTELVAEIKATEKIINDLLYFLDEKSNIEGDTERAEPKTGDRVDTGAVRAFEDETAPNEL